MSGPQAAAFGKGWAEDGAAARADKPALHFRLNPDLLTSASEFLSGAADLRLRHADPVCASGTKKKLRGLGPGTTPTGIRPVYGPSRRCASTGVQARALGSSLPISCRYSGI